MRRRIMGILGFLVMGVASLMPAPAMAADNCKDTLLGFRPWYYSGNGLICQNGEIQSPEKDDPDALSRYIWVIVLNVVFDLMLAVGYIALGMVIYGGYLYIMAQGDPGRAVRGKKTLTTAVIGVVIAMGATVIVNTLMIVLGIDRAAGVKQEFTAERFQGIFSWAYAMAGLVAVAFIVKAGVEFMIAQGDPGKIQKAKRSLTYSIVGLVVVIFASLLTSWVINSVGGAL